MDRPVTFIGTEAGDALLSNAARAIALFGQPRVNAPAADRLDRRLGHARRREARQADALRGARRQVLTGRTFWTSMHACSRRYAAVWPSPHIPWRSPPAAARRAPPARPDALLHRRRRRRARGRRAHDAVRDPRPERRAVRAGAGARGRGDGPRRRCAQTCRLVAHRRRSVGRRAAGGPRSGARCATSATTPACSASRRCGDATDDELIAHCRAVADVIPLVGFYLQPAVGGRLAAVRVLAAVRRDRRTSSPSRSRRSTATRRSTSSAPSPKSGRDDIALYTGNDDNIVLDLLTPYRFTSRQTRSSTRRIVGGLLGHWAVWTRAAVELLKECQHVPVDDRAARAAATGGIEVTDANAAFFDAANASPAASRACTRCCAGRGCSKARWCLDRARRSAPGRPTEIDRVYRAYPHLNDDAFVAGTATSGCASGRRTLPG